MTSTYTSHCYADAAACLKLKATALGSEVYRQADLSGAASATLSFSFEQDLSGGDQITLEVSDNGGGSYTVLETYDSATDGRARWCIHSAFTAPSTPPDARPRHSIESRAFVFF